MRLYILYVPVYKCTCVTVSVCVRAGARDPALWNAACARPPAADTRRRRVTVDKFPPFIYLFFFLLFLTTRRKKLTSLTPSPCRRRRHRVWKETRDKFTTDHFNHRPSAPPSPGQTAKDPLPRQTCARTMMHLHTIRYTIFVFTSCIAPPLYVEVLCIMCLKRFE